MYKKRITYTDYDGYTRTEDFYFNLTQAELIKMEVSQTGGMQKYLQTIAKTEDKKALYDLFADLVHRSYGVKSDDGTRFIKNEALATDFEQTPAYDELMVSFFQDENAMSDFVSGISPRALADRVTEMKNNGTLPNLLEEETN